jgi:hypothetical protein
MSKKNRLLRPEELGDCLKGQSMSAPPPSPVRTFATGANRDQDTGKPDYEGFLSPLVLEAFGQYMNFNRYLADGSVRDSDNWQRGMPQDVYMKSGWRHFFDWWSWHRMGSCKEGLVWACCGLMFNLQGYLHEQLKANPGLLETAVRDATERRAGAGK